MGEKYDHAVCEWRDLNVPSEVNSPTCTESSSIKGYVLVGDNIDKRVNPREMRVDCQVQSLHYFHTYAAKNRCDYTERDDSNPFGDILALPLSVYLPTQEDCMAIRDNYVIFASRIITEHLHAFSGLKKCVPKHISTSTLMSCHNDPSW